VTLLLQSRRPPPPTGARSEPRRLADLVLVEREQTLDLGDGAVLFRIVGQRRGDEFAHRRIGIARVVEERCRGRRREGLLAQERADPGVPRPCVRLDLRRLLVEPEHAAGIGRLERKVADRDDDPRHLSAEIVVELGHRALRPRRVAQDVLADVLDRLDRADEPARQVPQRVDPRRDVGRELPAAHPRAELDDRVVERLDPPLVAVRDVEVDGRAARPDGGTDVLGREDVFPVEVQPVQDELDRVVVEVQHLLSQRALQRLGEIVNGGVEVARARDVRHGFRECAVRAGARGGAGPAASAGCRTC
jgi:hypothetical protein